MLALKVLADISEGAGEGSGGKNVQSDGLWVCGRSGSRTGATGGESRQREQEETGDKRQRCASHEGVILPQGVTQGTINWSRRGLRGRSRDFRRGFAHRYRASAESPRSASHGTDRS